MKSCFQGLALGLVGDLADAQLRPVFEYHRQRIAAMVASQPDLVADEDTCAGFLHGFMTAGAHFVPDGSLEQESMFTVFGGILLLAVGADVKLAAAANPGGFFDRLATITYEDLVPDDTAELDRDAFEDVVRAMFATTPDVAVSLASLAGFVLGVLYAAPYLEAADPAGLVALVAAVRRMADQLRPRHPSHDPQDVDG